MFDKLFESRAISYQTIFESGDDIAFGTLSATKIDEYTIWQVNAVFSAVSLISDTISTLPIDAYINRDGARFPFRPKPAWVDKPDVDLPRPAFYSQIITSLLLDGNAFVRVFSNPRGEVVNLVVLNPLTVKIHRSALGRLMFKIDNQEGHLTSEEIIFIPDVLRPGDVRGVSRVEALKENFGLALALEKFASQFFGSGTNLTGVIEFPGNLTAEQARELSNGFDNRHRGWKKGHKTGVLSGGATFKTTQIDPEKSTLIESRNQAIADVARAFNVPPHLLALPGTNSYASVEQTNLAWLAHGLRPIIEKIETAITPLMTRTPGGENAYVKFNTNALVRTDLAARSSAYSIGLQGGWLSINDVRRWEDLRPIEDPAAENVRVPLANVNVDAADLVADEKRVRIAQTLILSGFDPSEALAVAGLDPIKHSGLPSVQLQNVANIKPEDPESVYEV
jgi:HK97 family phage portal protein